MSALRSNIRFPSALLRLGRLLFLLHRLAIFLPRVNVRRRPRGFVLVIKGVTSSFFRIFRSGSLRCRIASVIRNAIKDVTPMVSASVVVFFYQFVDFPVRNRFTPTIYAMRRTKRRKRFPRPNEPPFPNPSFLSSLGHFLIGSNLVNVFGSLPLVKDVLSFLVTLMELIIHLGICHVPRMVRPIRCRYSGQTIPYMFVKERCNAQFLTSFRYMMNKTRSFSFHRRLYGLNEAVAASARARSFASRFNNFFVRSPFLFIFEVFPMAMEEVKTSVFSNRSL